MGRFLLLECSPVRKTNMFEMQICTERNGENAILMYFLAIVPNIRSSGEPENIITTSYR